MAFQYWKGLAKTVRVICSAESPEHIRAAMNYYNLFFQKALKFGFNRNTISRDVLALLPEENKDAINREIWCFLWDWPTTVKFE